jgi:hypothetical protein
VVLFHLKEFVRDKINANESDLEKALLNFTKAIEGRWKKCTRNVTAFKSTNHDWLNTSLKIPLNTQSEESTKKRGRPSKVFEECGTRGKLIKTKNLVEETSLKKLTFATQTQLRKSGKRSAAAVVFDVTSTTPTRAKKYRRSYETIKSGENKCVAYSPEEALSLIINAKLSKRQYLLIRVEAKARNAPIYPSWHHILEAKQKCYPNLGSIQITESSAEVRLQDLLDLTTRRIFSLQDELVTSLPEGSKNFKMLCKWGCDGSSGQSSYKQRFFESGVDDSSVFVLSLVPLQVYCTMASDDKKIIIWQNPAPSSTRFCRAIKFVFTKESDEVTKKETGEIERQIEKLVPTVVKDNITVSFELLFTMVNGKVCNSMTDTRSAQICYICGAKPTEVNNLSKVYSKTPNVKHYSYGLSVLHSWIRFMECCLHISYRLTIKVFQVRGDNNKKVVAERKKIIIDELRQKLGILVDQPKPGFGSTNDGNTARTFFRNPEVSAQITGLNEELIRRFSVILKAMSTGFRINTEKFEAYAKETAQLYIDTYPWYYMPPSVHKVLIHGSEVIKTAALPIGQLSEEAQEAKNKDFKFVREHHTRKISRTSTNEDLLHYLLLSSDPIISHYSRQRLSNYKNKISADVLPLLDEPDITLEKADNEEVENLSDDEFDSSDSD